MTTEILMMWAGQKPEKTIRMRLPSLINMTDWEGCWIHTWFVSQKVAQQIMLDRTTRKQRTCEHRTNAKTSCRAGSKCVSEEVINVRFTFITENEFWLSVNVYLYD